MGSAGALSAHARSTWHDRARLRPRADLPRDREHHWRWAPRSAPARVERLSGLSENSFTEYNNGIFRWSSTMAVNVTQKAQLVQEYQRGQGDTGSPEVQIAL